MKHGMGQPPKVLQISFERKSRDSFVKNTCTEHIHFTVIENSTRATMTSFIYR